MCGISTIISTSQRIIPSGLISRMNHVIQHRGPDGEGFYFADHLAIAHRMLKIMDLGPSNVQPMRFKEYVVSYNGEIYNFRQLKQELEKLGYKFHTGTDTEVILAAYDAWKEDCVKRFVGMWAFVIHDARRNNLFCSRDRFGIKPLYYTQVGEKFLIGSEIKQFTTFNDFVPRLNNHAAFEFLLEGRLNSDESTLFENVNCLPAGCNLIYDLNSHAYRIKRWYDLRNIQENSSISLEDAIEVFREMFSSSMIDHLFSRVSAGSCLSGGMDTTSMVGIAHKIGKQIKTYSSCFQSKNVNEIEYIDAAIKHYGVENCRVFPNIEELITQGHLEKIVYQQDQPIIGGSFFSELKVYELAARHGTRVLLSGQGADEYLGGYGEFYHVYLKELSNLNKLSYLREKLRLPGKIKRATGFFSSWITSISEGKKRHLTDLAACLNSAWVNENVHSVQYPCQAKTLRHLSIFALQDYSLPHQLHSEDRQSMQFSIESRLPFLDHRLVEFAISLPNNFKIRNGVTKFVLREAMKSVLPPKIYNRQRKLGFPGPEEPLFIHQLPIVKKKLREYINMYPQIFDENLLFRMSDYETGKIHYNNFFFRVLSFGAWAKQFNVVSDIQRNIFIKRKSGVTISQPQYSAVIADRRIDR